MILLTTIDYRIELLPYFLWYYARLGIHHFIIGVWNGDKNPIYRKLSDKLAMWLPPFITADLHESISCDYNGYCGLNETPWLNRMRLTRIPEGEWYAIADLDEFIAFPEGKTFAEMRDEAVKKDCHTVAGSFLDRIALTGFPAIPEWTPHLSGRLDATFPLACDITQYCGAGTSKTVMARQDVTILSGHHYTFGHPVLERSAIVHHFKWNDNVATLLQRRHLSFHIQKLEHAGESARFMELLITNPNWRDLPEMNTRKAPPIGI